MNWYCLSNSGMATLCHNEEDAILTAKDADMEWPHHGPHRAVQLVPYKPAPDELVAEVGMTKNNVQDDHSDELTIAYMSGVHRGKELAAQKPWVELTDEDIWSEYQTLWPFHPAEEPRLAKDIAMFVRAIEAKLREKNAAKPAAPLTGAQIVRLWINAKGDEFGGIERYTRAVEAELGIEKGQP
jgi:hypothetical protein